VFRVTKELVTSSFSNLVNAPVSPAAQNATAIATATAIAIKITVAITGSIPFLLINFDSFSISEGDYELFYDSMMIRKYIFPKTLYDKVSVKDVVP